MKSRFIVASLGILAACAVGASSAFLTKAPPVAADTPQSSIAISESSRQPESKLSEQTIPPVVYTIKDFEGRIAIFVGDSTVPDLTFDVYTKHLPEYDQRLLLEGIKVEGYDNLMNTIEDYIS